MAHIRRALFVVAAFAWVASAIAQTSYSPPKGEWEHVGAAEVGFDEKKLAEAVEFAKTHESTHPRDFSNQERTFGRLLGAIPKERSGTKGLVIKGGRIVAEWGDVNAAEPTYSAAKSFLSTIAGIAVDKGLIKNVDDPVAKYVYDGGYDSPHNANVTWAHHLTQTSEWEGTLFGKASDFLDEKEFGNGRMRPREIQLPGTRYEYNDVRINRLALSLLRVFNFKSHGEQAPHGTSPRSLPDVLKDEVMDPIGASSSWKYLGYENSFVEIDGRRIQSVSGGTRWGGGLWISALDQARFGLLFLRKGVWNGKRLISEEWIKRAVAPSPMKPDYGYLWWLNTGRKAWPALSEKAFAAVGFGSNTIWVDPEKDLVIVWRWHPGGAAMNEFLGKVVGAMLPSSEHFASTGLRISSSVPVPGLRPSL